MPLDLFLAYVLACAILVAIPGPSVTLLIANSLSHGTRAGLTTLAGSQVGLILVLTIVGIGLTSFVEAMGHWFEYLRFVGAAYLVWLGIKMLRAPLIDMAATPAPPPRGGFALQGFLVAISNPKTLLFLGAFLPQFLDPQRDQGAQFAALGTTFLVVAVLGDGSYTLLAGRAGAWLSGRRRQMMTRAGGGLLIAGGAWLALARPR